MKYIKILAAALATLSLAACSNDDERQTNTASGVTVCMENATMRFREKAGIVNVPVAVNGTSNGYITVTCTVEEYGSEPAIEDAHYYMTAKTINIEPGATTGYFELATVDDNDINENRTFVIKINQVKGATIGNPSECVVTIRDDDTEPYDRASGEWYCPSESFSGDSQRIKVIIDAYDEGEPGYNTFYMIKGLTAATVRGVFKHDKVNGKNTISIDYGQEGSVTMSGQTFASELIYVKANGQLGEEGTVEFECNDDFTELTFVKGPQEGSAGFMAVLFEGNNIYTSTPNCFNVTKFTR